MDRFFAKFASFFAATRIYRYLENSYMDATWCIRGSKEGKSGGRWKDSLSSLRFVRPFFSSRAFNVNIFREEIGEYPPLFPIPFLCFPPVYSRSIRGGDPLDPRSSTLARLRFSFHASFLEGPLGSISRTGRSFSRFSLSFDSPTYYSYSIRLSTLLRDER